MPEGITVRVEARASAARRSVISWIRVVVSRVEVEWERSWESFARTQGWEERWIFGGKGREGVDIILMVLW